ncbi:bifunctional diaminohydroxyphosphoribosylaminopyrimidine deaminase/5-amino-6-(5-phosphoribosylamino)uracil reductase RibD [Marinagarivorans algicola]|uniref:bifunctional diaminohydroxyphosphoribosylaminopyrimidine deaminase/5-amino-6-(5-phosphoribosylamino)uracil reductase RibD n=1 Tax=Marinagarivorans algicola TaxID=1513270 RepID=UPI0006B61DE4|nr:bifunctional diaminohydroxyphosphoribosylaminopyrimidine deaminase/5-amino-6-(5-phosphoribosylamino)uracil reductase RibD [Marinagarivorans algicola]
MSAAPNCHAHLDAEYMTRALTLAEQGLYTTTPNPRVGCVLVKAGAVVAEGFHIRAGQGHAEINALAAAGAQAHGSSAYVTLEPCNHQGRTGPCSQALIDAGVVEVVYGMQDPNPQVAGQGLQRLRDAGIHVRGPVLESQALALNPGFIKRMLTGLPYVRCKLAMSLDGRTAMASGESQWITGSAAREDVQKLRARSCSIITGSGTVVADNPALTVRSPNIVHAVSQLGADSHPRQPLRIVVDSTLRTPLNAKILQQPNNTVFASTQNTSAHGGAAVWSLVNSTKNQHVDLAALIDQLGTRQHNEVLIEAGPTLAGAFMQAGLIDEVVIYMASKLMGSAGKPLFELPLSQMSQNIDLTLNSMTQVGNDWRIVAYPHNIAVPYAHNNIPTQEPVCSPEL